MVSALNKPNLPPLPSKKKKKEKTTQAVKTTPHINKEKSHFSTEYRKTPPPQKRKVNQ
jgi:hypothetical protein